MIWSVESFLTVNLNLIDLCDFNLLASVVK